MKMLRIIFILLTTSLLSYGQHQDPDTSAKKEKEKAAHSVAPTFDSGADSHVKIQESTAAVLSQEQYQAYQNFISDYDQYLRSGNYQVDKAEKERLKEEVKVLTATSLARKEVYLVNYLLGDFSKENFKLLQTAYNFDPSDQRVLIEMVKYHEVFDELNAVNYLKGLKNIGYFDASDLNFAKNQLYALPQNARLIANAKSDSYALWYAQKVLGLRKDVSVISLELMPEKLYRDKWAAKLSGDGISMKSYKGNLAQWIKNSKGTKDFISLTVRKDILSLLEHSTTDNGETKLHQQSGLAYHLNSTKVDANNELAMYAKMNFEHIESGKAQSIDRNYLPLLYRLYLHYGEIENKTKQKEIKELMLKIARDQGIEKRIKALL
jgi:hypothetical protein